VRADDWPTLERSRGKVMFLMENPGTRFRSGYLAGHASLAGRVMFTNSRPGRADAAFLGIANPRGRGLRRIRSAVRRGYMVRTRADADTREARRNDTRRRDAALSSGAHWISTDYPARGMSARFGTRYVVRLGRPARCNPVTAPRSCRDSALER
jgi:hypothetical protein